MKWSLSQLRKYTNDKFTFNETVQIDKLYDREDILAIEDINVSASMLIGTQRINVDLLISATVKMIDSRTGKVVDYPLEVQSVEVFDENLDDEEIEDDNLHAVDHTIDLEPIVRELIIVNLPTVYTLSLIHI